MSADPDYTSGSYFDRLQVQLELNVVSQYKGIMGNTAQNASQGVSPSISAVDTGIKAAMALSGALTSGIESAYLPALEALGLSGMACLPVSKQLDPVVGVDCHIMIPGGPLPIPYIGLLLNPKDFLAVAFAFILPPPPPMPDEGASEGEGNGAKLLEMAHMGATMAIGMLGATVKLGNFLPRAVAGTPTRNVFHFPIGGTFVAPPMNKGHAFMGSLNVLADDDPLSGGGAHLHMDCWDIGIPTPHLKKKSAEYAALFLPTGVIVPIPWMKPVLTNPIPIPINPVAALKKLLKGSFARFYKKKTKKLADKLHDGVNQKIKSGRLQNMVHKAICTVTGHPVDVASGTFFTDEEDFFLTGPIPLSWERTWYSKSDYSGPLGNGWHHAYDMGIVVDEASLTFRMNDGRPVAFPLPTEATPAFLLKERLEANRDEEGRYYIWDIKEDLYYHFTDRAYDSVQLLARISDRNGFEINFIYNERGHLIEIIDSAGRKLRLESDHAGRITAIYAPDPEYWLKREICISSYRYDASGNLLEQRNALGDAMLFEYEGRLMTREVWRNGMEWFFRYEGTEIGSRCIHTWGTKNTFNHKLTFFEGRTEVLDSYDKKTIYHHKGGLVYLKVDPNGSEYRYHYNDDNQLLQEVDPEGGSYLYSYDAFGNTIDCTDPEGGSVSATYFKAGELRHCPLEVQTMDGGIWSFAYDDKGNVVERSNPKGAKTKLIYEGGLVKEVIDPYGIKTTLRYDRWHNLIEASDSRGNTTQYEYDGLGRCVKIINPKGAKQTRAYDNLGRVIAVKDFDGNNIQLEYDGIDNLILYQDDLQTVEYLYEGMWKLVRRRDARGQLQFVYDCEERLLRVSNENWEHYHFELDAAGHVVREQGFDREYRSYQRDRAGRVIKETLPSGKFKEYEYDKCGRVTRIVHDYDQEEQTYSYYSSGRLQEAKNEHALVSFRYNNMGLPVEERMNEHIIRRSYNSMGQIASLTSSLGANLVYERNEFGELISFRAEQAESHFGSEHQYDSLGFELERMLPGGISQSFAYDNIGRLVDSKTRQSTKVRRERRYHWGKADRLLKTEDSRYGTTSYEYSPTGHLQKATYADGTEEHRLSDKVGNLFDDPDRKLRKYLQGGKIEQSGEWRFKYDKDGQLIEKYKGSGKWWDSKRERWQYEWNQNGTLKAVKSPHRKRPVQFTYDALGRRICKFASEYTHWVWNGNVPLHEWNTGQTWKDGGWQHYELDLRTWVFEEESFVPMALLLNGKAYSVVTDQLGTPTEAYNAEGEEVWRRRLDMNGKILEEVYHRNAPYSDRIRIPFLFQGQYYDYETGLAYNRFRYYYPELGRYISEDPIRFASGTLALHSYVSDTNDWVDTLGLKGTYAFIVDRANKVAYVGKGKWGRFRKSLRHKMKAYYGVIKAPNGWVSKFLGNDSLGEMLEAKVMKKLEDEGYTLLNKISSPGVRKLQDSGTAINRILDDVANDIIAEMEQNVTAPVKKGPFHV